MNPHEGCLLIKCSYARKLYEILQIRLQASSDGTLCPPHPTEYVRKTDSCHVLSNLTWPFQFWFELEYHVLIYFIPVVWITISVAKLYIDATENCRFVLCYCCTGNRSMTPSSSLLLTRASKLLTAEIYRGTSQPSTMYLSIQSTRDNCGQIIGETIYSIVVNPTIHSIPMCSA